MAELPSNICRRRGCGRRIRWSITMRGAMLALDPEPSAAGTIELDRAADGGLPVATFHVNEPVTPGVDRWMVHKATCAAQGGRRVRSSGWPAHSR